MEFNRNNLYFHFANLRMMKLDILKVMNYKQKITIILNLRNHLIEF